MRLIRLLMICAIAFSFARAADPIPSPAAIPDPTAFAVVYIPDLLQTIDRMEALAVAVNPQTPKDMMKMGLGMMLGDLVNLGQGPMAIVVTPGMPIPGFSIVLPAAKPDAIIAAVGQTGMLTKIVGTYVILSKLPDGLEVGERLVGQLATLGSIPLRGDLRIVLALDRVMTTYGPFLSLMSAMQGSKQPGMELLPAYIGGLQIVSADIQAEQIDISFGTDTLAITSTLAAKPGSELAKALIAPTVVAKAPAKLGDGKALAVLTVRSNPQALLGYMLHVLTELHKRPDTKTLISPAVIASVKSYLEISTGDIAMHWQTSATTPFVAQTVAGVTSATKAEAAAINSFNLMKPGTTLGTMYQNMGMTLTVTPKARMVGTIPISRVGWIFDASKVPVGQAETMKRFMMDSEFAFSGEFTYSSQGAPIDSLLTGGGNAPVLTAVTTIGPDRHAYFDADVSGLVGMISNLVSPAHNGNGIVAEFGKHPPLPPITGAGTIADGRVRGELNIPVKAIAELGTFMMSMNQSQHAPRPAPQPGETQSQQEAPPKF